MNVLHIVCHDIGRQLGCYGALLESPNLDRMAAQGVRFDRAFCSSPACSPSRMCAMTGRYAHVSGGIGLAHMGWPLPDSQSTIVDDANAAGLETAHFGFSHERHPLRNRYRIDTERHWDDQRAENAVDACIAWLRARDRSRPFYANVGTAEAHGSSFMRDGRLATYGGAVPAESVHVPPWLPDRPGVRSMLGRFQAAVRFLDAQVGRLLAAFEQDGRLDDTLVVFTTDHGIAEPLRRAKGTLYDRGCEVALLMLPPRGCPRGLVHEHLLPNIDLRATYAEALGIPLTGPVDGRSCWSLLQGRPYQANQRIFTERNFHGEVRIQGADGYVDRYDPVRAVRDGRWHYLRWFDPEVKPRPWRPWEVPPGGDATGGVDFSLPPPTGLRAAEELYDTLADPLELIDLAGRPECRAIKERLAGELAGWMRDTGDFVLRDAVPQRPCAPGWGDWPAKP